LITSKIDFGILEKKISILEKLGVPYSEENLSDVDSQAREQAKKIAEGLKKQGVKEDVSDRKITALIAYLQALGQKGGE